jgi:hypothetical protein
VKTLPRLDVAVDDIFTQVMVKQNGKWRVSASQNTNIEPVLSQLK